MRLRSCLTLLGCLAALSAAAFAQSPAPSAAANLQLQNRPPQSYPAAAQKIGAQGTVTVIGSVAPSGQVTSVKIQHSSGFDVLDNSALNQARQFRFNRINSQQQRLFAQPFRFVLHDAAAASSPE